MSNPFEGKVLFEKFEIGFEVKLIYLPNNRMKFIALTDTFTTKGFSETVDIKVVLITDDIYNICWVESNGIQVVQNIKLSEKWIYSVLSYNDENASGKRTIITGVGKYQITEEKASDYEN